MPMPMLDRLPSVNALKSLEAMRLLTTKCTLKHNLLLLLHPPTSGLTQCLLQVMLLLLLKFLSPCLLLSNHLGNNRAPLTNPPLFNPLVLLALQCLPTIKPFLMLLPPLQTLIRPQRTPLS